MNDITTYKFDKISIEKLSEITYGTDWPVVYIIEDGNEAYIGETTSALKRSREHFRNPERKKLKNLHIIYDDELNKSAALDIESYLIQYISADGKFFLQNSNKGLLNHSYYRRDIYITRFETIWDKLKSKQIVQNDLINIRNSELYKFSPYKSLSIDQELTAEEIINNIDKTDKSLHIVKGGPGTGKTILAIYLIKLIQERAIESNVSLNIGLVIPMSPLRKTISRVFKSIKGLSTNMVIGPSEVTNKIYDVIIVDEAHRLKRRVNVVNYKQFDDNNNKLGLSKEGTELDWILKQSKHQIIFYDDKQSIKPTDIEKDRFTCLINNESTFNYSLFSQMRIPNGNKYIEYIDNILHGKQYSRINFNDYDIKIINDFSKMHASIMEQNNKFKLCRLLAGYSWDWKTKNDKSIKYDFTLDEVNLKWNSVLEDWINSPNSVNEVGCIHTSQGYDLNYAGVIIGPEITFKNNSIMIYPDKYKDINGKKSIDNPNELSIYIRNIYFTLLTRGIKGTYIYVVDNDFKNYLSQFFDVV